MTRLKQQIPCLVSWQESDRDFVELIRYKGSLTLSEWRVNSCEILNHRS